MPLPEGIEHATSQQLYDWFPTIGNGCYTPHDACDLSLLLLDHIALWPSSSEERWQLQQQFTVLTQNFPDNLWQRINAHPQPMEWEWAE